MKPELSRYSKSKICVAVSGGKDSMALLHYTCAHAAEYNITVSAINFDHGIRGEESVRDSEFVKAYCEANSIKLYFFKWEGEPFEDEFSAREWRIEKYGELIRGGLVNYVATAHHMNDNAETILFNLARGSALAGMRGITDRYSLHLIRPLIQCSREEIDEYVKENDIPFVTDSTNLSDQYTRNKIRHNVLPALEDAVHGATANIYRFSRLAGEDEDFLERVASGLIKTIDGGFFIKLSSEKVLFRRACRNVVGMLGKRDYTSAQFERLYALQLAANNKRFEFLNLVAIRENGGIAIVKSNYINPTGRRMRFMDMFGRSGIGVFDDIVGFGGEKEEAELVARISASGNDNLKIQRFDLDKIPRSAVTRFKLNGDKFTAFGGAKKSLSNYFTDKKVPQVVRGRIPLVCDGGEVLIICGVEISDTVKVTEETKRVGVLVCRNLLKK